ncbi:nickel/cobalt transporter [Pusillimonas noertemannii]|uniref:Nickel/cobalt efflux system n=1 Tax=Pusillimonas noertemannii TaxID=305977 RepID=A0A2U1CM83_9BURK|nr:nickel/cobalt transporter [Pusillimonas noertemannii]NYT68882.1 nickel/cobalt transporter [Pusillimonas noertemannii]PVY62097.1 ABC-type nickel/cobalt efflux system permease component RcnA [Pusillimonas noertemannii]TFL10908.1 nickel/cobalt transporter [Pusillimonas noertemannii]
MQMTRRPSVRMLAGYTFAGALLVGMWALFSRYAVWSQLLIWIMKTQAELHQKLASTMRLVADHGWTATWPLIGISLLYGIFHAAGPGHGKAVITTYLGTSRTRLRRGLFLSISSAIVQGLVAVVLVEVVANLLGYSLRRTQGAAGQLENASFALVALLGAVLALRSAKGLYRRWREPKRSSGSLFSNSGRLQPYCADCGGPHQLTGQHLNQPLSWRTALPIILAIGMRPCTGAILILLVAYSLGLRWVGIAAVLAMSLGTAATVSLLATLAVSFRHVAMRFFQRGRISSRHTGIVFEVLGLVGGTAIGFMGVGLLRQGLATVPHPLL